MRQPWGKHIQRYREIGSVLARYGLYRLVRPLGMSGLVSWRLRRRNGGSLPDAEALRLVLEELGAAYVKMGQLFSTRADLMPEEYIKELAQLQEEVPPEATETVLRTVSEEFGGNPFKEFSPEPLAAASLGQVHDAVLPDGTEVAVKVQRCNARKIVETDTEIMIGLAEAVEKRWEKARLYNLACTVREFAGHLLEELDYCREGRNIDRFREVYHDEEKIYIHKVFWEYTTPRVLTVEKVSGLRITDIEALRRSGRDLEEVARELSEFFMKQIFLEGLFHGDPHPGNLRVLEDGTIALLDFGLVDNLDLSMQRKMSDLFLGYVEDSPDRFTSALVRIGVRKGGGDADLEGLQHDVELLLRDYYNKPFGEVMISRIFRQALSLAGRYDLVMPSSYALLVKVLVQLEGIVKELDPNSNLLETARPFARRILWRRLLGDNLGLDIGGSLIDTRDFLLGLPRYMDDIFRQAAEGRIKVRFEHHRLGAFALQLAKSANRMAFSLIVAALLVSTALLVQAGVGPFVYGYPLIAVLAFAASAGMGVWLLVWIIRSGELG